MRDLATPPASTVAEGGSADVLAAIHQPGCAAAIWQRGPNPVFQAWLDALPAGRLPQWRETLPAEEAGRAAERACRAAGLGASAGRRMLCDDVQALAGRFARIMAARRIALRLDVVRGDACRRFHVDFVPARLLCTYRGRGTEYGLRGAGEAPETIHRMRAGWVGIFRGRNWPAPEPCALVHRSPPLGGSDEARLLLVLDVAERGE